MLYFVGVGPGDPELMTLKAARVLREADAIALADRGAALQIVDAWIEGKPVLKLNMPMKGDRAAWEDAHRAAAEQLMEWLERYERIAYPVLGDPGVYASSSYLLRLLAPRHECRVIPGVPAMCAAAAELGIPLCEQRERLTVMDDFSGEAPLPGGNVVVMKSGRHLDALRAATKDRETYAVRNLGMADSWAGALPEMPESTYSYFTTVLVKA